MSPTPRVESQPHAKHKPNLSLWFIYFETIKITTINQSYIFHMKTSQVAQYWMTWWFCIPHLFYAAQHQGTTMCWRYIGRIFLSKYKHMILGWAQCKWDLQSAPFQTIMIPPWILTLLMCVFNCRYNLHRLHQFCDMIRVRNFCCG